MELNTIYVPVRASLDEERVIKDILLKVKEKRIGLLTTAQFAGSLQRIAKALKEAGKEPVISPGRPNPGQILGCDAHAAKGADAYVYIGSGRFHPLRAMMETGKVVYMARPIGGLERIDEKEILKYQKIKAARISKFNEAKRVGVMVSTKPGQERFGEALELKKSLDSAKETFIFVANEIKPEVFLGIDVDVWVNTACPRIFEDSFERPVLDISWIR